MTDRDNYQRVGIELDQQSFNQLKGATDTIINELNQLQNITGRTTDSIARLNEVSNLLGREQTIQNVARQYAQLGKIIGDDTNALRQMRIALKEVGASGEEISRATHAFQEFQNSASGGGGRFGVEGLRRVGGAVNQLLPDSDIGPAIQRLGDLGQITKELGEISEVAGLSIGGVTVAIGAAVAVGAVFSKVINDASAGLGEAVTRVDAYYAAIEKGTTESLQAEIKSLEIHKAIEDEKLKTLQTAYDRAHALSGARNLDEILLKQATGAVADLSAGGKELNKDLEDTQKEVKKTQLQIDALKEALKSSQVATNDAVEAEKKLAIGRAKAGELADTGAKAEADALKKLNDSVQEAQKAAREMAQKQVDIVKRLDDQITSIEENAAQSRLQSAQKLQDALIKAAQNAVDAADKALTQLEQKRDDNLLSLNRDLDKADREAAATQLNDQIAEQRKERDNLQTHLEALQQIKDRDQSRERDDLLNRNFRDLFSLKDQQNTDIQSENRKYDRLQEQERQALADQLDDEKRAQVEQRKERLIAYQQANQDALKQYNIEIEQTQIAKQKAIEVARQANRQELSDLNSAVNQKIKITQAGAKADLQIVNQTEQEKFKIFQNYLNRARELEGQSTAPAFNSPQAISAATPNAEGGVNPAYQPIRVNDKYGGQRESVNGMLLPRGLGLFIPMTNASINPGAGGGNTSEVYNNTFNIVSHDPAGVRQEVIGVMNQIKGRRRS